MENENKEQELCVFINEDAIDGLSDLGFVADEDGKLVKETDTGAVIVDTETNEVAILSDDGISTNEVAIVAGLVSGGMATIETANDLDDDNDDDDKEGITSDADTDNDLDNTGDTDKSNAGSSVL